MKIAADLHLHTNFSDGVLPPEELVERAIAIGLKAIAISDHDNIGAIDPAKSAADGKLQIISAVELSSEICGKDLHILGYFIDDKNELLLSEIGKYRKARHDRALKMVENLSRAGMPIDFELIKSISGDGAIGRPHIARAMVIKKYASSTQDAFYRFLRDGSPIYEPKYKIDPFKAFDLIKKAGGISVWAHPGRLELDHKFPEFIEAGLNGVEVFHPGHDWRDQNRYLNLALRYQLIVTGGSDYHGHDFGAQIGDHGIDKDLLQKLNNANVKENHSDN